MQAITLPRPVVTFCMVVFAFFVYSLCLLFYKNNAKVFVLLKVLNLEKYRQFACRTLGVFARGLSEKCDGIS
jgi:hypothetical protein